MNETKSQDKISVIVPVYNTAPYLKRCLDSMRQSTYQNLEIICVNDGSTDESLSILEHYQALDDRVVVIDQNNRLISHKKIVVYTIMNDFPALYCIYRIALGPTQLDWERKQKKVLKSSYTRSEI